MARTGRPRVQIDLETAEKLGQIQCTLKECAAFMNIPEGTLANREDFTSAWKKGQEVGKISLRRLQFRLAEKSAGMAIWLGKQYLDQSDKVEMEMPPELKTSQMKIEGIPQNGEGMREYERFFN